MNDNMKETSNSVEGGDHQLWVNLSALGGGNIFSMLPQMIQEILSEDDSPRDHDVGDILLPSDDEWRTKIYYKLVEQQRLVDASDDKMVDPLLEQKNIKLHDWNIIPKKTVVCDIIKKKTGAKTKSAPVKAISWTVNDIAKAGRLLAFPQMPTEFLDEQEMRRVYTLIYDVFRYKNVLNEALDDINFFQLFPKLSQTIPHVWLLFYDLYHRGFKKREAAAAENAAKLLSDAELNFAENALFTQKVKLAAAVARLRIKHNALSLSDLLPPHLKDEKVTEIASKAPVTCWVNTRKVMGCTDLCDRIQKLFNLTMVDDINRLGPNNFKRDKHCPQIIAFHSSMRQTLARSSLIQSHELIVQDKSFCLGPATFGKIVSELELTGSVIQTHINSPRSTAYLASILAHNEKIKKLMAFNAGKRKSEYEEYFDRLGMDNIVIFADRLIDLSPDSSYMEEVVAVFATPPNSYSAVNDPIDLVCSRGGDLSMLEVLTESEETKEGKERIASILDEQRKTLRFAMSRPQIQFVLYETHSGLEAENERMVTKALREVNKVAKIHHAALQGKLIIETSDTSIKEINNNEKTASGDTLDPHSNEDVDQESINVSLRISDESKLSFINSDDKIFENLSVPDTDLFDTPDLPSLCPSEESCMDLTKEGCYLALLQRKQVIRLDNKYMINMAEQRGLFGSTAPNQKSSKGSKASKKKLERPSVPAKKVKRKLNNSEDTTEDDIVTTESNTLKNTGRDKNTEVVVKYLNANKMLGRLSVYQLRELVSASYKGQCIYKTGQKDAVSGSSKDSRFSKRLQGKRKMKLISNDAMNDFIKRLCTPTQASLSRNCNHEEENAKQTQKTAMECATREFQCERCRRRNC